MNIETKLIELIAVDRIDKPISSMSGKLKRLKPKLVQNIEVDKKYNGERVWARIDEEDESKARGTKEGIEKFTKEFPKYGKILNGYITAERTARERYLVFGMQHECRITADDYRGVMTKLGFTPATAETLYPELMDISRKLTKKRDEYERSILIEQNL
jgi:hypothetical protein